MDAKQFVEYINSKPELKEAYGKKTKEERMTIYKQLVTPEEDKKEELKPLYTPIERDREVRKPQLGALTSLGSDVPKTVEEVGMAGVEAVNSYLYGLPNYLTRRLGYEIPEPNTMIGKGLKTGGTVAGIAGSPFTKAISKGFQKVIPSTDGLGSSIMRGTLEGGSIGYLQTPKDDIVGLTERGINGLAGAALGAVIGTINGAYNSIAKYKAKTLAKPKLEIVTEKIGKVKESSTTAVNRSKRALIKSIDKIKTNVERMDKALKEGAVQQADIEARQMQTTMRESLGDLSSDYGVRIEESGAKFLKAKGEPISKGDMSDILQSSVKEIKDLGVDSGMAYNEITNLANRFKLGKITYGDDGLPIIQVLDDVEPVQFKDAFNSIKGATSKLSAGFKSATQRAKPDDIAANILRKNWYNYLGKYDKGIQELNTDYATAMREIKPMMQLVKPYGVDTQVKQLANTINNVALGKASPNDIRLLSKIEDGVGMYRGTGTLTDKSKGIGNVIKKNIEVGEQHIANLEISGKKKVVKLNLMAKNRLEKLGIEKEAIKELMRNEKWTTIVNNAAGISTGFGAIVAYAAKRYATGKALRVMNIATGGGQTSEGQ